MFFKQAKTQGKTQNITQIKNTYTQEQTLKKQISTNLQRKARRRLLAIMIVGLLMVVPLGINVVKNLFEIRSLDGKIAETKEINVTLAEENQNLKVQVGLLQDDEYVAKLARSRYYLSKDGELIFSLPEDNRSKAAEKEISEEKSAE
ncbi:septum formation initiator family protein [Jeotgalibaca arthritidis]|uniref:Septum formation initiator family protein n=1 Tax=Jeotgalibaca arthritidis TaxID=1868794 RepID=A0A6G7K8H4_9LACT|nr:septum formation initiator family protein [Jeotgalibaca arthritidis]QII81550.1 septum formation initiator family protein [Jeotgalibaca arthritidis]